MIMNMLETAGTSMQRSDAARSTGHHGAPLSANGTSTQAGGFHQLLARLSGQDLNLDGSGQSNVSGLLLLQSQLQMLGMEEGTDASQQLAWLEQLTALLEQSGEQLATELQQQPELAQMLAAFVMAASQTQEGQSAQLATNLQDSPDQLVAGLKDLIQQFAAKLSTNTSSAETTAAVRGLQQILEPLLAANHASIQVHSEADKTASGKAQPDAARTDLQASMQRVANSTHVQNGNDQQQVVNGANERLSQPGVQHVQVKQSVSMTLPRADLLRPELLALAMNDGEAQAVEVKLSDVVVANTNPSAETVKTAGELSFTRVMNAQPEQVPAERFVEAMNRVVTRSFQVTQMNGIAEARISLMPEHLGQVDIKLTMQNGQLTAQLVTETVLGREALEQQLGALRSALQGQGIQVEKLEVVQQSSSTTTLFRDHGQQQHSSRQYEQPSQSNRSAYEEDAVAVDFAEELELIGTDYDTTFVQGRSFTATA